ncbi:MAG: acetyl-CoA hydrolase/transferase family protein, partial [Acidimicrobiia bacterium]
VDAAAAVGGIASGQRVFIGSGAAEPGTLVDALTARAAELRDVEIVHIFTLGTAPYVAPEYASSFRHVAFFVGPNVRTAVQAGRDDFVPVHLHEIPRLFERQCPIDWALVQLSPPDRHGFCSVGVSADVVVSAIRNARHVVAELNPQMPRTWGPTLVPLSELHSVVEVDAPLPELAVPPSEPEVAAIGRHVAELVRDGDCLQLGIGSIPAAVAGALFDHRHLGVHSEMVSDGMVELIEAGAVDGSRKTFLPGKVVTGFAMGTRDLYSFVDDNPLMSFWGAEIVNDPSIIATNANVVAVNSALEVDLTGQVNADSLGNRVYSGIGGQVDFIRGATQSDGGRPIIALRSTAQHGAVSRIVATLSPGAGVVTSRGDVHHVVTEHGAVDLFGRSVRERARAIIDIADPRFREELERQAHELHYLGPDR